MKPFLLLLMMGLLSLAAIAQNAEDKVAVEKVVISFQDDFNDGSFKKAIDYASADWVHIAPNGGIGKGRDTLINALRSIHQAFLKGVTMTIESITIRFITADVAIADAIHIISNYTTPDGVLHEKERQIKSYVIVKQKGKWLLTLDHNTIIQNSK